MGNPIIFQQQIIRSVEENIKKLLNSCEDFNNARIVKSPRSVGDTVQGILEEELDSCFPSDAIREFKGNFTRRAMADVAFVDLDGNYYVVDIKTHNKSTDFNMPNLTSVKRLADFYRDNKNYFVILLVEYQTNGSNIVFDNVRLFPIEHMKWDCLNIGALGWGQIQIANANIVNIDDSQSRQEWMTALCRTMADFYDNEISKIDNRRDYFEEQAGYWNNKTN